MCGCGCRRPTGTYSMIADSTPVNELIMRLRNSHTLRSMSLVSVYGSNEVSEFFVKGESASTSR